MHLTSEQNSAIAEIDNNLQIIACAGSGKTEVITRRIANILANKGDVRPENIVAFTFTEKAAENMRNRIISVVGEKDQSDLSKMYLGTIHAFCRKLLFENTDIYRDFEILDTVKEHLFIARYHDECGMDMLGLNSEYDTALFVSCIEKLIDDYENNDNWSEQNREVFNAYKQCLINHKFINFSMLIHETLEQIGINKEINSYLSQVKYLVVDEYQDIDDLQEKLIRKISEYGANICVVGDDDQTIYQFRGSNANNMIGFASRYCNVSQVKMETNFRCAKAIVDVADTVIKKNSNRLPKQMVSGLDKANGNVFVIEGDGRDDEYKQIAQQIKKLYNEGTPYFEIAILIRKRKVLNELCDTLEKNDIPFIADSTDAFFEGEYINAFTEILRFMRDADREALYNTWINYVESESLVIGYKKLRKIVRQGGDALQTPLKNIFEEFISSVDFTNSKYSDAQERERDKLCFLRILVDVDKIYADQQLSARVSRASTFIERSAADEYQKLPVNDAEQNGVQIMTVHKSKGLEFDTVFIPDLEKGMFPARKIGGRQFWHVLGDYFEKKRAQYESTTEDERKLFYVAVTRAKKNLYIGFDSSENDVSNFVEEACRSEYVDFDIKKVLRAQSERNLAKQSRRKNNMSYSDSWENEMNYGDDYEETITIDVVRLQRDMKNDAMGAFFGGGFGGAMIEASDIERASPEELVEMAQRKGIDLRKYSI